LFCFPESYGEPFLGYAFSSKEIVGGAQLLLTVFSDKDNGERLCAQKNRRETHVAKLHR
jgi:hypothetical protein